MSRGLAPLTENEEKITMEMPVKQETEVVNKKTLEKYRNIQVRPREIVYPEDTGFDDNSMAKTLLNCTMQSTLRLLLKRPGVVK